MSKVPDQFKALQANVDVGYHRLFGLVAVGITQTLQTRLDRALPLQLTGKRVQGHKMSASLSVSIACKDAAEREEVATKVRRLLDELKNPAKFTDMLERS